MPPPPPKRQRKSRSRGLRARTGCTACRTRRVKCPEERPKCANCQKSDRECVYPLDGHVDASPEATDNSRPRERPQPLPRIQEALHAVEEEHQAAAAESQYMPREDALQSAPGQYGDTLNGDAPTVGSGHDSAYYPPITTDVTDPFLFHGVPDKPVDTSPGSSLGYTAETGALRWFDMLATDATQVDLNFSPRSFPTPTFHDVKSDLPLGDRDHQTSLAIQHVTSDLHQAPAPGLYTSSDNVELSDNEKRLFRHFVVDLSSWLDVTDVDRSFATVVPSMALRNSGLMAAILALSSRHLSLISDEKSGQTDRTIAVSYYSDTLRYLQHAMKNVLYLRSDELLATVLTISTYEMIDGSGRGWERHLKGVFWIQRSQLIHGESEGLKARIWWAWIRQDIWAAYREKRKILSFYTLTRACSSLDFWGMVNRGVFLLGQCINYSSDSEVEVGRVDFQARLESGDRLLRSLEEWQRCFAQHNRRLPAVHMEHAPFEPIWINPPAASIAVQVHNFAKLLLLEFTPALGGMREMVRREPTILNCVEIICGIASCVTEPAAMIVSIQCLYAAGLHVREPAKQDHVIDMMRAHQKATGWPRYDIASELRGHWTG